MSLPAPCSALDPRSRPLHERAGTTDRWASRLSALAGLAVVMLVASPMLFTRNGFAPDFTNTLWLGAVQEHTVTHGLFPSYFINTTGTEAPGLNFPTAAMFEPIFAFYGGTLFAILGWLAVILGGSTEAAFDVLTVLGISAAYFGWYWLGRQCRLSRPAAHAAPITYVSAAYYLTDLYGRGDWPELMAISAVPLAVAAGAALSSQQHQRRSTWVALFVAALVATGSHNLTLIMSGTYLAVLGLLLLVLWHPTPKKVLRLWRVVPPVVLAVGLNCWFLVPDIMYSTWTQIYQRQIYGAWFFDTWQNLFDPLRAVPSESTTPGLFTQFPVEVMAWVLVVGAVVLVVPARNAARTRTAFASFAAILAVILYVLLRTSLWTGLPEVVRSIQFPFRFVEYVDATVAALVIVVLHAISNGAISNGAIGNGAIGNGAIGKGVVRVVATGDGGDRARRPGAPVILRRAGMGLLGVALASSLGFATWQIWVPNVNATNPGNQLGISYTNRSLAFTGVHELPTSWYARVDYADAMETTISTAPGRTVKFSPADLNADGDRLSALLSIPDGKAPIDTNLAAGPYLISITGGVERVGRDGTGYAVIERTRKMTGPVRITVSVARSTGVRLGQGLTELAFWLLVLLALVQAAMVAAKRRRPALTAKRRRSPPVRAP